MVHPMTITINITEGQLAILLLALDKATTAEITTAYKRSVRNTQIGNTLAEKYNDPVLVARYQDATDTLEAARPKPRP